MNFSSFPAQWEWVALILGGIAFIMAIPPIFQMIWGKPHIDIEPSDENVDEYFYLTCNIRNLPISKGILYHLGVRRESAQDVTASFEIREAGTNRVICPSSSVEIKTQSGVMAERVSIPASFVPCSFALVVFDKEKKESLIYRRPFIPIAIGSYKVRMELLVGPQLNVGERSFVVSDQSPFIYWLPKTDK